MPDTGIPRTPAHAAALSGWTARNDTSFVASHTWTSPLPPYNPGAVPVAASAPVAASVVRDLRFVAAIACTLAGKSETGATCTDAVNGSAPADVFATNVTFGADDDRPRTTMI